MNRKGFTLIELILVIAILGILAVSALPKFLNLSENAEEAARDGVIGAVRSGAALYRANDMVQNGGVGNYPTTLESGGCCFNAILTNPVEGWTENAAGNYTHDGTGNVVLYNSTNGTFNME